MKNITCIANLCGGDYFVFNSKLYIVSNNNHKNKDAIGVEVLQLVLLVAKNQGTFQPENGLIKLDEWVHPVQVNLQIFPVVLI